jgi:predicted rRNA methylase YqxC with S4 and FtsJ domains
VRQLAIDRVIDAISRLGLQPLGCIPSPLRGHKGNLEALACFVKPE